MSPKHDSRKIMETRVEINDIKTEKETSKMLNY